MKNIKKMPFSLHILKMCKLSCCFLLVFSLGCNRRAIPVHSQKTDSVRVERATEYIERVRWDTVYLDIPAQSSTYAGLGDSSYLETDYASSMARILDDGSLYHDLYNKPQKRPVVVPVIDTKFAASRDSIVYRDQRVEVPIRMPLTWRERLWVASGKIAWILFASLTAIALWRAGRKIG